MYATGYLRGQIIIKESNWEKDSKLKRILKVWKNGIIKNDITSDRGIAIIRSNGRRGIRDIRISQNGEATGRTLSLDGGKSKRDNVGDNSSGIHNRERIRYFGELNNIDYVYMNGYEGGAYNVIVTVYSPDEKDEVDDLISRGTILYDKKRNTSQRSSSGFSPSLLNDVPFESSVQQDAGIVKDERRRFSKSTTATAEETEAAKRTLPSADAQMIGKLTAEMDELARNSGKLPQGVRVKRDIAVPRKVNGKKTMLWARTFFESESHNERRFVHTRG